MVKVFQPDDTTYTSNGDIVVQPLKAVVHKEDGGDFYLDLEAGARYSDWLDGGNIVVATTPQSEQAFRIRDNQKTRDKVILKAKHVYYDTQDLFIQSCEVINPDYEPEAYQPESPKASCGDALNIVNTATDRTSPFTVGSDIEWAAMSVDPYEVESKSLFDAINEISEKFGKAHIVRNNWNIQVNATIGQDNGVTISYGKNLVGITRSENWDNVCTKLLPVGKDGATLTDLNPSETTPYISSATFLREEQPVIVPTAPVIIVKSVQFEQDLEQGEDESEADYKERLYYDLLGKGKDYFRAHCVPVLCYELKAEAVQISDIGDTVEVKDEELGINVMTHVVSYDYDVIQGRYTGMTFASHNEKKLSHLITNITAAATDSATKAAKKEVEAVQEDLNGVKDDVSDIQQDVSDLQDDVGDISGETELTEIASNANFNDLTVNRYYHGNATGASYTNAPAGLTDGEYILTVFKSGSVVMQEIGTFTAAPATYRRVYSGSWSEWA